MSVNDYDDQEDPEYDCDSLRENIDCNELPEYSGDLKCDINCTDSDEDGNRTTWIIAGTIVTLLIAIFVGVNMYFIYYYIEKDIFCMLHH